MSKNTSLARAVEVGDEEDGNGVFDKPPGDLGVAMLASYGHALAGGGVFGKAAAAIPYLETSADETVTFDDGVTVPSGMAAINALDAEHHRMLNEVVVRLVAEMSGPGLSLRSALRNLADNPKFESFWKQLEAWKPKELSQGDEGDAE